jgi:hypothetical protein
MREGEEGISDEDNVVEVTVVEEEDTAYKQTTWIWIGPRGRPT